MLKINRHFRPPVGAVSNRTGLECLINSKIYYNSPVGGISESRLSTRSHPDTSG